jgi:hypothetical protein
MLREHLLNAAPRLSPTQLSAPYGCQTLNEFHPVVDRASTGTLAATRVTARQIPSMRDLALVFIVISFFFGTLGADGLIGFLFELADRGKISFPSNQQASTYGLDSRH